MTALITALLLAQGLQPTSYVGYEAFTPFGPGGSSIVLNLPLSATGSMFEEDAGTVAHVTWNGSAIIDTKGNAWTQNGTVPQVAAGVGPWVPGTAGAGPFSAANYYQGPTSLMEWAGDWSITVTWKQTAFTALNQTLISKLPSAATAGWSVIINSTTGYGRLYFYDGAAKQPTVTVGAVLNGPNILTVGKSGGTCYARMNQNPTGSAACGTMTAASSEPVRIGRHGATTDYALESTIYEVIASTTPYSDALHDARFRRAFGLLGTKGEAISIVRATPATNEVNGLVWNVPAGVPRINASGLLVESARTNAVFWSGALVSGTTLGTSWLNTGAPTFAEAGTAPDGVGKWGRITSTTVGDVVYQSRTITSTTTVTASAWMKADSGTDTVSIQAGCAAGTNTACTCGRSDGGSTTARPGVTLSYHCTCDFNSITTTPIRGWAIATCAAATTTATLAVTPGSYNAATGTADFWGAQLEAGAYPSSYIPTAGTATARNADVVTAAIPPVLSASGWCVVGDFTRDWSLFRQTELWSFGSVATPNTARAYAGNDGVSLRFDIWDGANAQRTFGVADGLSGRQTMTLLTAVSGTGGGEIKINGTPQTESLIGVGTALFSASPTLLSLGDITANDTEILDGYIKNFKVYRSASCR